MAVEHRGMRLKVEEAANDEVCIAKAAVLSARRTVAVLHLPTLRGGWLLVRKEKFIVLTRDAVLSPLSQQNMGA
jgi:hypothetical protein